MGENWYVEVYLLLGNNLKKIIIWIIIVSIVIRVVFFIRCIFIIGVIESVVVWGFIK